MQAGPAVLPGVLGVADVGTVATAGVAARPALKEVLAREDGVARVGVDVHVEAGSDRLFVRGDDLVELGVVRTQPSRVGDPPIRNRRGCAGRAGRG